MNTLFIAQFAVPVALILWMALAPPRSASGFVIQYAASALGFQTPAEMFSQTVALTS